MLKMLLNKLSYALLIFLGVSLLTFCLGRLAPGDGLDTYLRTEERLVSDEDVELARERLGMNDPIWRQYLRWMGNVLRGDFGISYRSRKPVTHEILLRLPNTLFLTVLSLALGLAISVPAAWFCAKRNGSLGDHLIRFLNTAVIAMPMFCIGLMVMLVFGVRLRWFPITSGKGFRYYVMPMLTMGIGMSGGMIRYFRTQFLESCRKEHVLYARAIGVRGSRLFCNHILFPLLPQLIVYLSLRFAGMLGGSYIIESMYSINGSGSLLIGSVGARDYPMIQGYAVMMAAFYVLARFGAEAAAALLEPRLRRKYEAGT